MRHENINRPNYPCEEDIDYNFDHCIEKSIVTKAGCQPYWNKFDIKGIQFCNNGTMLKRYTQERNRASMMYRNELIEASKCLMPCSFMEYKVSRYEEIYVIYSHYN